MRNQVVDLAFLFGKTREAQRFLYNVRPQRSGAKKGKTNMALTRKFLKALEIEGDKADQIIEAHTETVDGLKASLEAAQTDAGKAADLQKQLEAAQADLKAMKDDGYKVKYEALKEEHEAYKTEQAQKETRTAKENAYRALLKGVGISEKRIDAVLRVSDVDGVELTDKGVIKGADKIAESIKAEWADFIVTTETKGVDTPNPPANTGGGHAMTAEQIDSIKDIEARQLAMYENPDLFGI